METLEKFTNLYQLSKTLRFELIPVGKDGKHLQNEDVQNLLQKILEEDKKIKESYDKAIKPIMDQIHEQVINKSLTSEEAKLIDFSSYFEKYQQKKELKKEEASLRKKISDTFDSGVQFIKEKTDENGSGKSFFKKKGVSILSEAAILKYIENNITDFVSEKLTEQDIKNHIEIFKGFFTYLSGYNKNRENYYSEKEKSTAITTRIVHDNLPKFCDNCSLFLDGKIQKNKKSSKKENTPISRKEEYLSAYQFLKVSNKITQIKDAKTNKMIEAYPIDKNMFEIAKFSDCLSQSEIEDYNRIIGHYNSLINLYNQARGKEKDFRKLVQFKTLYKQIGCGKRSIFYHALKYDTRNEQNKVNDEISEVLNLEETLTIISNAGKKYFLQSSGKTNTTILDFVSWLKQTENWDGIYWSKATISKISNRYLANWHDIKDRLQVVFLSKDKKDKELKTLYKEIASFDRKREEQLKINDVVELSSLFKILDQNKEKDWSKLFFKETVLEDWKLLIDENLSPSKNLINLICAEIESSAKYFCNKSEKVFKIRDYKNDDNILEIKHWFDIAKAIIWHIKYFEVQESKVKGNSINPELSNMLTELLHSDDVDWFGWYDIVRNYLTKKPQDAAKENKLKLNFGKSNLLNGFVDSFSDSDNGTQYGGYLFRRKYSEASNNYEYFLGISKNQKLFRCHLQNSVKNNEKSDFERLEYYQPKETTFFDENYRKNKATLINTTEKLINDFASKNGLANDADKVIKRDNKGETTPSKLFNTISKNVNFASLLEDDKLLTIINSTIQELKQSCGNFIERNPKLKNVQSKDYIGIEGYNQIIKDLQTVAKENKVFNYFNVSKKEFNDAFSNNTNSFYLFKISNKDLSFVSTSQKDKDGFQKRAFKGKENTHTVFFRALMREYNDCLNIDLGNGEIFFREAAEIKQKQIHRVGEKMVNRREKGSDSTIPYYVHNELFLLANEKIQTRDLSKEAKTYLDSSGNIDSNKVVVKDVKHEIIKDKRFTENKFQLHLSISLNFNQIKGVANGRANKEAVDSVNHAINDSFIQSNDIQFLGIDRGEKHLIYYSLLDSRGNIIEQNHFDIINGKDYLTEINNAAKIRRERQENWQQKGNISNLKDGYISLVIHEIIQKMKDEKGRYKPTFIVLEDLNREFKRSRQKFEQQVYEKFELALAKKLNFLVDKNVKIDEIGSVAKALQLTPPIVSYREDIEKKKQVGIMLYTRANYTSITDPATGWRKTIYLRKGKDEDIKEQIVNSFSEISLENGDYFFEYKDGNSEKTWRLWSSKNGKTLKRYRSRRGKDKNEYIIDSFDVRKMLDDLFSNFDKNKSLLKQLKNGTSLTKVDKKNTAWESLRFVIDLIQQIRNSGDTNKGQKDNFLLSPVRDEHGNHFDSREYEEFENSKLPKDADANGAYNIARKGIIMHEHIKEYMKSDQKKQLDLFVSDKEWDLWLNDKNQWSKELSEFAMREKEEEE